MHVSTLVRRSIALLAVLTAASACSDTMSAPRAAERPAFDINALRPEASRSGTEKHGPGADFARGPGPRSQTDENVATLTIDPNVSRTYSFGQNWIYFPAHSICDPATSGYGSTLWDAPCTAVSQPITVTVEWSSKGGYAYAHFSPELRFVPASSRDVFHWVVLSFHTSKKLHELDAYTILYNCGDDVWVDESLTDPTLRAWLDPTHDSVYRRVKHFSGYMVAAAYSGFGGMSDAASY
jgi:hypothetical protein